MRSHRTDQRRQGVALWVAVTGMLVMAAGNLSGVPALAVAGFTVGLALWAVGVGTWLWLRVSRKRRVG
jgi:hypothetical protein